MVLVIAFGVIMWIGGLTSKANGGSIGLYTSTELGSEQSYRELKQVKMAGFDSVIAYGSMNGRTTAAIRQYFDAAQKMGIGVVFSIKDVLGATDTDPANQAHHRLLFGVGQDQSTDAQVATIAVQLLDHPAVKSVLISDERPRGPEDLEQWLPRLEKRYDQISKIKPTTIVLSWSPDSLDFYKAVRRYAHNLQINYYPFPEGHLLPVDAISEIGDVLWRTAGSNGCFVLQAFGWDPRVHSEGIKLGFNKKSPPPSTGQMVESARLAVEANGHGGATNLAFYAAGDPNAASFNSMKEAIKQIRRASWWRDRGN
ncbi:MAG: hypothetical protein JWP06_250 [Candidatus Saccharibacteria bacterium]|nr:hypothetical protein [Candidatus Saccharibacteria bacterium]